MFDVFSCGPMGLSPHPPHPFTPAGAKGSWNSQFGFLDLDTGFGSGVCDARLDAYIGAWGSRSEWHAAWIACGACLAGGADAATQAASHQQNKSTAFPPTRVCNVSASERAHAHPSPLGRAEQRSGARIRAGACLSVASLRTTPGAASSARYPAGPRPLARLFFGYFLLAKQKKVTRPAGRNLALKTIEQKLKC